MLLPRREFDWKYCDLFQMQSLNTWLLCGLPLLPVKRSHAQVYSAHFSGSVHCKPCLFVSACGDQVGRPLECGLEYVRQQPHGSRYPAPCLRVLQSVGIWSQHRRQSYREFRQITDLLGASFLLHSRVLVGLTWVHGVALQDRAWPTASAGLELAPVSLNLLCSVSTQARSGAFQTSRAKSDV